MVAATAAGLYPDLAERLRGMQQRGRERQAERGGKGAVRPRLPGVSGDAPAEAGAGRAGLKLVA